MLGRGDRRGEDFPWVRGPGARGGALRAARGAAHAGEEAGLPRGGPAAVGAGGSTKISGEFSSGKARCHREEFSTAASSWHRGFPDECDRRRGAGVRGGSGENEGSPAVSHRARPDATVGRACGPLGGAARRAGCCARGGGGRASAGRACGREKGVGLENFRGIFHRARPDATEAGPLENLCVLGASPDNR